MKVRSITVFSNITLPLDKTQISALGTFAHTARQAYEDAGFEVQTTRLATSIFPTLLKSEWAGRMVDFAKTFEGLCRERGFEYVALGAAPYEVLAHLPEIFAATQTVFATTHIVSPNSGTINGDMVRGAAHVIHEAARIENGFGNLRYAALANVSPGTPFFPGAYHDGGNPVFAIATESADLAVTACTAAQQAQDAHQRLVALIEEQAARIVAVAMTLGETHKLRFGGIDFSLAPFPAPGTSIGAALEALSGQPLGAAGTLTAAATLTDAIDQAQFPHTGFCGLMMPVLEDAVLAQRAAEGRLNVGELLQWSAVCGTGLDTVPLPGDASEAALARLLFDVAALSARLHKPLTARLMPLPGKVAGDPVHFDFAYFADGGVLSLGDEKKGGMLGQTLALRLSTRHANISTKRN